MPWGSWWIEQTAKHVRGKGISVALGHGWVSGIESGIILAHLGYRFNNLLTLPGTCMASHLQGTCSLARVRHQIAAYIQSDIHRYFKSLIQSLHLFCRHKGTMALPVPQRFLPLSFSLSLILLPCLSMLGMHTRKIGQFKEKWCTMVLFWCFVGSWYQLRDAKYPGLGSGVQLPYKYDNWPDGQWLQSKDQQLNTQKKDKPPSVPWDSLLRRLPLL